MTNIERKHYIHKNIHMSCVVQFPSSGNTFYGHTQELSLDAITVELSAMPYGNHVKVRLGEVGLLILHFVEGYHEDIIRMHCQVTHMTGNGMGLSIRFYDLTKKEQELIGQVVASNHFARELA